MQDTLDAIHRPAVVLITGPTAVGKSNLALRLASRFNAEIVAADSRTVYTGLDIGTAKPTAAERAAVPHHLIDVAAPAADFSLVDYLEQAKAAIADIVGRSKLPFVVGGTPQYINALLEGWGVPPTEPQHAIREALEADAAERGAPALYAELTVLDPDAAAHILPTNTRRIVRALEVIRATGRRFSELQAERKAATPPYYSLKLAVTLDRAMLYAMADARIDRMIAEGWLVEARGLLAANLPADRPALTGLGYNHLLAYLRGEMTLTDAVQQTKYATHRFIRAQYVWFRRDPDLIWLQADDPQLDTRAATLIEDFVAARAVGA